MIQVQIYSRHGCHLCDDALATLKILQKELNFEIEEIFIDGNLELEANFGERVPVIQIGHVQHDFFRIDPVRFRKALASHQ